MKTSSGISGIVDNIMASYEARVKAVSDLSKETAEMCRRFRKEREDADIMGHLAEVERNRRKDYNGMMDGIHKNIGDIRQEVAGIADQTQAMLANFRKEREKANIRGKLAKGEKARRQDCKAFMDGINNNINDIRKEVSDLAGQTHAIVAGFRKEREDADIKGKLAKGEKVRQGEYKNLMGDIHGDLDRISKEVADLSGKTQAMMSEFQKESKQMAADWQAMEGAIKHGAKPAQRTKAAKKTAAKEQPQRTAPQEAEREAVEAQDEVLEAMRPGLPEQILEYIGDNAPEGVKIGEMEGPLGVSRMKLGKAAKELLEEGKLRKEDGRYFLQ